MRRAKSPKPDKRCVTPRGGLNLHENDASSDWDLNRNAPENTDVNRSEIRIRGRVSAALLDGFEGMASDLEPVETGLHGPVRDQSELHGLIDLIQALGLELIEVRRLPS